MNNRNKLTIENFGGYNHKSRVVDGDFYDMLNLSGRDSPLLSVRKKRGVLDKTIFKNVTDLEAVFTNKLNDSNIYEAFAFISDNKIKFYTEAGVQTKNDTSARGAKTLVSQAGYLYSFPDNYQHGAILTSNDKLLSNETSVRNNASKSEFPTKYMFSLSPCLEDGSSIEDSSIVTAKATKINQPRTANSIVVYTDTYGQTINLNEYGIAVKMDSTGKVIQKWNYGQSVTATLSSGQWFVTSHNNDKFLTKVNVDNYMTFDNTTMILKAYEDSNHIVATTKPSSPANGQKWIDNVTGKIYVYNSWDEAWHSIETSYLKLEFESYATSTSTFYSTHNGTETEIATTTYSPFDDFNEGDSFEIKGFDNEYDSTYVISKLIEKGVVLGGHIENTIKKYNVEVTIKRRIPKMDFVIQCANRLWGCYYGIGDDGKVINEIFCSAQGDPFNWYKFEGTAEDSYYVNLGEDGKFTGAIVYGDYPMFFKEDCIIRVFGSSPSTYELGIYHYPGIREGSSKSAVVVGSTLYYHSRDGILSYSGSVPVKIDEDLNETFTDVVAGGLLSTYYFSGKGEDGKYYLFTYEQDNSTWYKEDNLQVKKFVRRKEQLYMVAADGYVYTVDGNEEKNVKYSAETGNLMYSDINEKRLCILQSRAIVPHGSSLYIDVQYDDSGVWENISEIHGIGTRPITTKIVPVRCDRYKIRLHGAGDVKIISLSQIYEYGSNEVK